LFAASELEQELRSRGMKEAVAVQIRGESVHLRER
jgi:hypothetical protein